MFLLVQAYPGCPGSKAVKRSLCVGAGLTDDCALHHAVSIHTAVEAFIYYKSMQLAVPSAQSIGLALSRLYKPASQCATLSQTVTYL